MKKSSMNRFFIILAVFLFAACLAMLIYFRCPWWTMLAVAAYFGAMTVALIKFVDSTWVSVICLVVLMALSMLLCSATRGLTDVPFVDTLVENLMTDKNSDAMPPEAAPSPEQSADVKIPGTPLSSREGYTRTLVSLPNCTMELLTPTGGAHKRVIYQLHGGSYVDSLEDFHRENALRLCAYGGNCDVASLDYRTYPEATHPAALEDALDGYRALTKVYGGENIIIEGDSAGGGLALALTASIVENGLDKPAGVIALCPWADMTSGVIFPEYAGDSDLTDPSISPAFGDYGGFPPLLIQVGTADIIYADSLAVYEKATADGADAVLSEYKGEAHDFQLFYGDSTENGKAAWEELSQFIKNHFGD